MSRDELKPDRLTAHIGRFERRVPGQRWRASAWLTLALLVAGVGGWELKMRSLGLQAGDLDDGKAHWAVERRKVDSGPRDQVVILGDSRILLDTNLRLWKNITGIQPIQLALQGTGARPFLRDIAEDEHFAGLVVLGIAEPAYFSDQPGSLFDAIAYTRNQSPAQRIGHQLGLMLSRVFAFIESDYRLYALLGRLEIPDRKGVIKFLLGVGQEKLAEAFDDRQTSIWPRWVSDKARQQEWHRLITQGVPLMTPFFTPSDQAIDRTVAETAGYVAKIRARGGEVVIVRPPSDGAYLQYERIWTPRSKVWDRLIAATQAVGINFEDYPAMQGLTLPDWSHLTGEDARVFTAAYLGVLCQKSDWLHRHAPRCNAGAFAASAGEP
jgi:hypothetical protein